MQTYTGGGGGASKVASEKVVNKVCESKESGLPSALLKGSVHSPNV